MNARLDAKTITLGACILAAAAIVTIGGPLDPPAGPVAPSYKTLSDVEPRTAINTTNTPGDADSVFRITSPGSYYLAANALGTTGKSGIEITSSNVTIDLNGFRLQGLLGSQSGIHVTGTITGLTVRNGKISGWGADGIDAALADDAIFADLGLTTNVGDGLECGRSALVERCTANSNAASGFNVHHGAVVRTCTARANSHHGFMAFDPTSDRGYGTFEGCAAISNLRMGFSIWMGGQVTGCQADLNGDDGIGIGSYGVISNCTAVANTGTGIISSARAGSTTINGGYLNISGCFVSENGGEGIYSSEGHSTITECVALANTGNGIRVRSGALVLANTCNQNGVGAASSAGIFASSSDNRIEGNNVIGNDRGIDVSFSSNIITRNSASGNAPNYDIAANNVVGTIVQGTLSPAISGSTGGSGVGTTNPWANLSY